MVNINSKHKTSSLSDYMATPDNNQQVKQPGFKNLWNRHLVLFNILIIIVSIPVLVFIVNILLDLWTHHGSTTIVPNVREMSYDEAVAVLDDADLEYVIGDSVYDLTKRPGQVVDVFPKPGAVVKPGREVYLTIVSFSPQQIVFDVPVDGQSVKAAEAYLKAKGIKNIHILRVPSPYPDLVLSVKQGNRVLKLGSKVPINAKITLEVGQVETPVYRTTTLDSAIDSIMNMETEEANSVDPFDSPTTNPEVSDEPVYE